VRTSSRPSLRDFSQQVMKERKDLKRAMEVLQGVPLFSELTVTQLERLANSLKRKEILTDASGKFEEKHEFFPEGVVIQQGEVDSHTMYVVESGKLQACVDVVRSLSNPDGVVKEYAAGDFFGELAIVTDQPRSATVRCVETCVLLELERSDVLELLPGQLDDLIGAHRRQTAMQVLKKVPMFSDLTQSQIERLANNLKRKEILTDDKGEFPVEDTEFPGGEIIKQGEQGDTMFVVESGCAPLVPASSRFAP
jgi:CRP-like cAMP-binding protein